ncbi:MAG: SDR family oxidoreductase [Pseudomonadota bacterium]
MNKVLIVGATSAIAEQCARIWAQRGDALTLTGRDDARLQSIAEDLRARGATTVHTQTFDVTDHAQHANCFEQASTDMQGLDVVLIAHGSLPDQAACEADVAAAMHEIDTNGLSVVSLMSLAANHLAAQSTGTLAVISSVAGDRGRASNYVYGSAKAMVTTFASGMRQRLAKSGVNVVTIKPGFVDTPMTAAIAKGALWAQPDAVARTIVAAIDRGRGEVYVPSFWYLIMFVIRHIPTFIFKRLSL